MAEHLCHAKGCTVAVPPRMFMCRKHWFMLSGLRRAQIYALYRPGQEVDKQPSREYLKAAREAIEYVAAIEEAA